MCALLLLMLVVYEIKDIKVSTDVVDATPHLPLKIMLYIGKLNLIF